MYIKGLLSVFTKKGWYSKYSLKWLWIFLILFILILEGYFLQNRIIFDSVDKLLPVSNMAYSCLKKC